MTRISSFTVIAAIIAAAASMHSLSRDSDGLIAKVRKIEDRVTNNERSISTIEPRLLPCGAVIAWPGAIPPTGWVICRGQSLEEAVREAAESAELAHDANSDLIESAKSSLAAALEGSVRPGHLPDYRGYFLRGIGKIDPDGERKAGSIQPDSIGPHRHKYIDRWGETGGSQQQIHIGGDSKPRADEEDTDSEDKPGGTGPETRPKNVAVNYVLKVL